MNRFPSVYASHLFIYKDIQTSEIQHLQGNPVLCGTFMSIYTEHGLLLNIYYLKTRSQPRATGVLGGRCSAEHSKAKNILARGPRAQEHT